MSKTTPAPTAALYDSLLTAYNHFNQALFNSQLPPVLFTVQKQAGMLGYFMADRWAATDGKLCHEIAINPSHIGTSRVFEVLQTLVHEMVHCWQHCYGTPATKGYHNKEWAYKMMDVGLHPSTTGAPGGNIVGMKMSDYVIDDGPFWRSCISLIEQEAFHIPWVYRVSTGLMTTAPTPPPLPTQSTTKALSQEDGTEHKPLTIPTTGSSLTAESPEHLLLAAYQDIMPDNTFIPLEKRDKAKRKYHCNACGLNAWAKPGARILCIDCDLKMDEV